MGYIPKVGRYLGRYLRHEAHSAQRRKRPSAKFSVTIIEHVWTFHSSIDCPATRPRLEVATCHRICDWFVEITGLQRVGGDWPSTALQTLFPQKQKMRFLRGDSESTGPLPILLDLAVIGKLQCWQDTRRRRGVATTHRSADQMGNSYHENISPPGGVVPNVAFAEDNASSAAVSCTHPVKHSSDITEVFL